MSTMRTTSSSGGSRLVAVRMRSGCVANASSRGSLLTSIAPVGRDLGRAGLGDAVLEALGHLGEVEVHPGLERLHVAAGDQRAEVAEHHAGQQVQAGVGAHQGGAPRRPRPRRAPSCRPAGPGRPRRAAAPGRRPCGRRRCGSARRPTAARRGPAAGRHRRGRTPTGPARCPRASVEDGGVPLAQRLVGELEPAGAAVRSPSAIVTSGRRARAATPRRRRSALQLGPHVGEVDAGGDHADHVEEAQRRA